MVSMEEYKQTNKNQTTKHTQDKEAHMHKQTQQSHLKAPFPPVSRVHSTSLPGGLLSLLVIEPKCIMSLNF